MPVQWNVIHALHTFLTRTFQGNSVLIGILITIIAFSISISLYIRQASTDSRDAALSGINVTAQITQNRSKAMKQASGSGGFNRSEMKKAMGQISH